MYVVCKLPPLLSAAVYFTYEGVCVLHIIHLLYYYYFSLFSKLIYANFRFLLMRTNILVIFHGHNSILFFFRPFILIIC